MLLWLALALLNTQEVVVVGVGTPPGQDDAIADQSGTLVRESETLLSVPAALARLAGVSSARVDEDVPAIERMMTDARQHEARFETEAAWALQGEILRVFDATLWPSPELTRLATLTMHDLAASRFLHGDRENATALAKEALRRFPRISLDTTRHPPRVQDFFAQCRAVLETTPADPLTVSTDAPGELVVDGATRHPLDNVGTLLLAPGRYRVWLEHDGRLSLPRLVNLNGPTALSINASVEHALARGRILRLDCIACQTLVSALCHRLAPARCAPVVWTPAGLAAYAPDEDPAAAAQFDPLWLVPFGVGQWRQDRFVAAGAIALSEAALLAWHVVAIVHHTEFNGTNALGREERWRRERNLAGTLFIGSIVVGVGEAVLHGLFAED